MFSYAIDVTLLIFDRFLRSLFLVLISVSSPALAFDICNQRTTDQVYEQFLQRSPVPEGCTPLYYRDEYLTSETYFTYAIAKRDVLCISQHVVIDQPLLTNGGNLYVFSDKLTIAASVDTRVYREVTTRDFFEPAVIYQSGTGTDLISVPVSSRSSLCVHNRMDVLVQAVSSYYAHCNDCKVYEFGTFVPRLLDGPIAKQFFGSRPGNWEISGQDAHFRFVHNEEEITESENYYRFFRSGDVLLATRELEVAQTAYSTVQQSSLDCRSAEIDVIELKPFILRGAYGGRGGMGSIASHLRAGPGPLGRPGHGGHAGSLALIELGVGTQVEIEATVDTAGGAPQNDSPFFGPTPWNTVPPRPELTGTSCGTQ